MLSTSMFIKREEITVGFPSNQTAAIRRGMRGSGGRVTSSPLITGAGYYQRECEDRGGKSPGLGGNGSRLMQGKINLPSPGDRSSAS